MGMKSCVGTMHVFSSDNDKCRCGKTNFKQAMALAKMRIKRGQLATKVPGRK